MYMAANVFHPSYQERRVKSRIRTQEVISVQKVLVS